MLLSRPLERDQRVGPPGGNARVMRQQRAPITKPRAADTCRQTDRSKVYRIGNRITRAGEIRIGNQPRQSGGFCLRRFRPVVDFLRFNPCQLIGLIAQAAHFGLQMCQSFGQFVRSGVGFHVNWHATQGIHTSKWLRNRQIGPTAANFPRARRGKRRRHNSATRMRGQKNQSGLHFSPRTARTIGRDHEMRVCRQCEQFSNRFGAARGCWSRAPVGCPAFSAPKRCGCRRSSG